jgi:hypothetical protein
MVGAIASPLLLLDTQPVQASEPQATALVLSCIDFRFLEWERGFLAKQQLDHHYDWTALAGASLALSGYPHGAEAEAFWDQLDLSRQLHHIKTVIILDHQDCGAYASKIDRHLSQDPKRERQIHRDYLSRAYWAIGDRYLELTVELYFITLSGEVQRVNPVMPQSARV